MARKSRKVDYVNVGKKDVIKLKRFINKKV